MQIRSLSAHPQPAPLSKIISNSGQFEGNDLSMADQIHAHALAVTQNYKRAEAELIDVLQKAEEHRVFLKRGHSSLFRYVVDELGLSESAAYSLITVARKAREVPELKVKLQSGEMTLSNARRVVSVLTPQNQADWIEKATELTGRQLEREIVRVKPQEATPERASYVSTDRVRLELGLSEREMLRLRRVQDLMSQASRKSLSIEDVIAELNAEYLRRHDPVEKAKRHQVRKPLPKLKSPSKPLKTLVAETSSNSKTQQNQKTQTSQLQALILKKRVPIPAVIQHQVNLRDQRRCAHVLPTGQRCNQSRWIEIHHKVPVSRGGSNAPENLITLCSAHHKLMHLQRP